MSPEGVRHLAALGVLDAVEGAGGFPIRGTRVSAPHGASLTGLFARAGHPFRSTGLSVPRRTLDHALVRAARAAGAEIREGSSVVDVVREENRITGLVTREGGRHHRIMARLVVGADGLHSVMARSIGRRHTGLLRRYALAAHVESVAGLGDTAELHVGPDGYAGLNPLGGGVANVALVIPRSRMLQMRGNAPGFFFEELERFPGVRGRVQPSRLVRRVMATGPFARWTSPATAPGAVLLGDAADFFDPFTGEGMCAAFRGAELVEETLLEPLLGRAPLDRHALVRYRAARRQAFLGKWIVERLVGHAMLSPAFFNRAVRRIEQYDLSHTLIAVTGDYLPARAVLNPRFFAQVVL